MAIVFLILSTSFLVKVKDALHQQLVYGLFELVWYYTYIDSLDSKLVEVYQPPASSR